MIVVASRVLLLPASIIDFSEGPLRSPNIHETHCSLTARVPPASKRPGVVQFEWPERWRKTLAHLRQATTVGQAFASFQPSVASKWMAALGRILLSFEIAVRCRRPRDGAPTLTDSWGLQPPGRSTRTGSSVLGAAFWVGREKPPDGGRMAAPKQARSMRTIRSQCAHPAINHRHYVFDGDTYSARPHPIHLQTVAHADETRSRTDRATALRLFVDLSPQAGSGSKLSIHAPNKWPLQAIASRLAVAVSVVYHSLFLLSTVWPLATRMIL